MREKRLNEIKECDKVVYCPTQLTDSFVRITQFMTNTSEKYQRTQQGNLLVTKQYTYTRRFWGLTSSWRSFGSHMGPEQRRTKKKLSNNENNAKKSQKIGQFWEHWHKNPELRA